MKEEDARSCRQALARGASGVRILLPLMVTPNCSTLSKSNMLRSGRGDYGWLGEMTSRAACSLSLYLFAVHALVTGIDAEERTSAYALLAQFKTTDIFLAMETKNVRTIGVRLYHAF